MGYGVDSLEKRMKDNIKNYSLEHLYPIEQLNEYLQSLSKVSKADVLLTERHGEKTIAFGNLANFNPDVVNEPGRKIKIAGRTVGHLYVIYSQGTSDEIALWDNVFDCAVLQLTKQGEEAYYQKETLIYVDELEKKLEKERYQMKHGEKEDALTGVLNSSYFESRLKVIDRAEIVPVAVMVGNINDWKYVNDNFGEEESDRLIRTIAQIVKEEAKADYVIGRADGDVFHIVIPMAEEEEARDYCARVQEKCDNFADDKIAPSIAFGYVMKTNVEQSLEELFSDAEYEMFQNKFEIKSKKGYRERLEK